MKVVEDFKSFLVEEGSGRSPLTAASYGTDIEQFILWLGNPAAEASAEDIVRYKSYLLREGMNKKSINRKLSSLRNFYEYLHIREIVGENIASSVKNFKVAKVEVRRSADKEDVQVMLALPGGESIWRARDKVLLATLYRTGMRRSECSKLGLGAWKQNYTLLEISAKIAKGGKLRFIPIVDPILIEMLRWYVTEVRPKLLKRTDVDAFFVSERGNALSASSIYHIVKKYSRLAESRVGRPINMHPHKYRHSFATHWLDDGLDIKMLMELMGHEDIRTTEIYTHESTRTIRDRMEKVRLANIGDGSATMS